MPNRTANSQRDQRGPSFDDQPQNPSINAPKPIRWATVDLQDELSIAHLTRDGLLLSHADLPLNRPVSVSPNPDGSDVTDGDGATS